MVDSETKKEIAVIGSEEFTLGFRLAGIKKTFESENFEQKIEELLKRNDIGILVAEEQDIQTSSKKTRQNIEKSVEPVVMGLSEDAESERLQEKIKKAIGADIT
ncbi:V-type ATP synthase subunit F [Candidatus Haloredivivus sp. G17]|jgi:V/A-type H+-transporting ATPase subunit F|nr:V-type ATP synthase subunit F [Candidatus Haloredivivus sp. G17]